MANGGGSKTKGQMGMIVRNLFFSIDVHALAIAIVALAFVDSGARAQNVTSTQILGQPLVYMKAGKLDGCGIRLIIVDAPVKLQDNIPIPVWDLSFNLYLPGRGAVKVGSYNVSAAEMRLGKASAKSNNVPTAAGWLKAPNADPTAPLQQIGKSDDPGFILYWTELDSVLALFKSHMRGEPILVGTRRTGARNERVFSGTIEMSGDEKAQVGQCLAEFLAVATK
jgi:hypothetical protein